jgi:hypothetical protein
MGRRITSSSDQPLTGKRDGQIYTLCLQQVKTWQDAALLDSGGKSRGAEPIDDRRHFLVDELRP